MPECFTPWCYGECEACQENYRLEQEAKKKEPCHLSPGPYVPQSECGYKDIDIRHGGCLKCGYSVTY